MRLELGEEAVFDNVDHICDHDYFRKTCFGSDNTTKATCVYFAILTCQILTQSCRRHIGLNAILPMYSHGSMLLSKNSAARVKSHKIDIIN